MRNWGLLAGLAAILAALVLAGGEAVVANRLSHAKDMAVHSGAPASRGGTAPLAGFFAGAGMTSPL